MSRISKLALSFTALALFLVSPLLLCAQDNGAPSSITGCLKQGTEKGGYFVTAQDGNLYELLGDAKELSSHVNHTITVTGHSTKLPESQEARLEPHEKTEASGATYVDFKVSNIKMVSASCQ
jgi:hypothetical protein